MTTEKQTASNRANALHSTGPRTEQGKASSSKNATRHSLTSKYLIILPGQEEAFAELESGLRSTLLPAGPLEEVLFKRAVECAWNLERCRQAELTVLTNLARSQSDPLANPDYHDRYDRIHRYARESENSLYKAMRELGKLQSEQQYRQEIQALTPAQSASLSQVCSLSTIMKHVLAFHKAAPISQPPSRQLDAINAMDPREYEARFEANPAAAPEAARAAA